MKKLLFAIFILYIHLSISAETVNHCRFKNYQAHFQSNSVRFITQDSIGLMWVGTNKGLYSFDGYKAYPHFIVGDQTNKLINCGLLYDNQHLLLGTESGFLLYDMYSDVYRPFCPGFTFDIKALSKTATGLWIGCTQGLFRYDTATGKLNELLQNPAKGSKHKMVFSLLEHQGAMYVGTMHGFGRYSLANYTYQALGDVGRGIAFVSFLLKDTQRNCIWIGQGNRLLKYYPATDVFDAVEGFAVVKTICANHENDLFVGTDGGLRIYDGKDTELCEHDSREQGSLLNNVVWCAYKDKMDNMWLGTNNGISVLPAKRQFTYISIAAITGTGEGNQFYAMYRDSLNNYWLGGSNGLICKRNHLDKGSETQWYKMDESPHYISHNHIRAIYADRDQTLWTTTDWGINRYDYKSGKFVRITIQTPDAKQYIDWVYDLLDDGNNKLWMATYNNGVCVVDKGQLLQGVNPVVAEREYSTANGLLGNHISFIVQDHNKNIWVLVRKKGLNTINAELGQVSTYPVTDYTNGIVPSHLLADAQGVVWLGYRNGALRIDPTTGRADNIVFSGRRSAEVLSMAEVEQAIWVSTTEGLMLIDKTTLSCRHLSLREKAFTAIYYHKPTQTVLLGGIDGVAVSDAKVPAVTSPQKIVVSAIWVNNQLYNGGENAPGVRFVDQLKLAHNQNNIKIELSDLVYAKENSSTFVYKISDSDDWTPIASGDLSIRLFKLNPGTYNLAIGVLSVDGETATILKRITIAISAPWYKSMLAKIVYYLLMGILAWWIYYFFTAKSNMKYEQLKKEKSLEQSRNKIAFFTDVAHEFKTPLSLIIAPLSRLIQNTQSTEDTRALKMVHQNALKLNSLIYKAIDFYRDDNKESMGLLLSKVELVGFARSILLSYKEGMKGKQVEFVFNTNTESVFINVDVIKMESVFNNLLSNACKFTKPGDRISCSLEYRPDENGVELVVSDTGAGIPEQDLPYIFQRFYQSADNSKSHEGTGIGLFIAKNYVELHKGHIQASSTLGQGASFKVWLPIVLADGDEIELGDKPTNENTDKELIVIVEDNVAIAEYIYNTFIAEYRCFVAYNGKAGLKACIELNPDLIISDMVMPVMDGLEMARNLKKHIPTSTTPLVFLTAKDDKETELKSIELNIDAFIAKPFDAAILYSRVKQLLNKTNTIEKKVRISNITSPEQAKAESMDEKFLTEITGIIEANMADPDLNVNTLCELSKVSSKQLYRKVKLLTGMTTVEYIRSIRLKKAALYFSNKNFSIAEVMYMVGYSNHSYFAKCFQKQFGKTPSEYIEQQSHRTKE